MNPIPPKSLIGAIIDASQTINKETPSSSWFGKKIYLSYNENTGWKIQELGIFDRLLRRLNLAYKDTHFNYVCQKLNNLTPEETQWARQSELMKKLPKLKEKLNQICQAQAVVVRRTPSSTAARITSGQPSVNNPEERSRPRIPSLKLDEVAELQSPEPVEEETPKSESPPVVSPLYLKNYQCSRCYIDSVLEVMLSQDVVRQKIFQEYQREDMSSAKKELLQKLMNLIVTVNETQGSGKGDQSPVGKNSPGEKIREAIFASKLNYDLSDIAQIYTQQDAAAVLLLINDLLENTFETVEVDTAVGLDIISQRPKEVGHKLELRLEEGGGNDLTSLLDQRFDTYLIDEEENFKTFELENGIEFKAPYTTQTRLLHLPESMALHISRYKYDMETGSSQKMTNPVSLPQDGIVDLTPYYHGKEAGPHKYEITGYVVHRGKELNLGHYTANIKIGNKYYKCDDLNPGFYKEISAQRFYSNQKAYLVMLKKIPVEQTGATKGTAAGAA